MRQETKLNPDMREVLKHLVSYHVDQLLILQNHHRARSRAGRVAAKPRSGLRLVTASKRSER